MTTNIFHFIQQTVDTTVQAAQDTSLVMYGPEVMHQVAAIIQDSRALLILS